MKRILGVNLIKIMKGLRIVKRGPVWYGEACKHGRQSMKSMDTTDASVAAQRALEWAGGAPVAVAKFKAPLKAGALSLDQAMEKYEDWYEKERRATTGGVTLPRIRDFIKQVGGDIDTRAVTQKHVQAFVDSREGLSYWTTKNDYARIRAFLKWIEKKHNGAVDLHCVRGIDLPKDEGVTPEAPTLETIRAVLRKVKGHPMLEDYLTCLLEIGCRPGELLAIRGVDIEADLLKIRPHDGWKPKSKWSVRTIQITPVAAVILNARKDKLFEKTGLLFGLEGGKMRSANYTSSMYRDVLRGGKKSKAVTPAEFKDVDLYSFRHAFASLHAAAFRDGKPNPAYMPLQQLAAYMGHGPGSTHLLERHYADRDAMRAGAPPTLIGEPKETVVTPMVKAIQE